MKEFLYEKMQSAFSTHHPRFPFPKRHDLVDQTPEFQRAFAEFTESVNEEMINQRKIEIEHAGKTIDRLIIERDNARFWNKFALFVVGLCIGAFIIGYVYGLTL